MPITINKDEIIRMAREAGFSDHYIGGTKYELERFAALVADHEREACAKVCDELIGTRAYAVQCAAAIRARSEK